MLHSIQDANAKLCKWAEEACPGAHATLNPPGAESQPNGSGISIYLLEVGAWPAVLSGARPPLQLYLRYLVTAQDGDTQKQHEILNALAFSALDSNLHLESEAFPVTLWPALGIRPQPSLLLRVAIQRERETPAVNLVRQMPELTIMPASELLGVVMDSNERPLERCSVEVLPFNLSTDTDCQGRFRFAVVPRYSSGVAIRVRSPLGEHLFPLESGAQLASPLKLRIDN
jgi:hypothetical protein